MNPDAQIFFNNFTTSGTGLGGVFGIDFNQRPTGAFCLVRQKIKELCPCRIVYVFVQNFVIAANHLFRLQGFDKDKSEPVDYISAELMQKIFSLIANFSVQAGKILSGFASTLLGMFTLKILKLIFGMFQVFRIIYDFAIRHNGKGFDTDIDSDFIATGRKNLLRNFITGKTSVKMPVLSFDSNGLDLSFKIPVQFDSDASDVLNVKLVIFKLNPIAVGRKGDRIETVSALKSWKSGFITSLYATEKSSKRFVQSPEHILRSGIIKICDSLIKASYFLKRVGLIVIIDRFAPLFPTDNTMFKGAVIEISGRVKKAFKLGFLGLVCKKPIFERFSQSLSLLGFDIFFNRFLRYIPNRSCIIAFAPKGGQSRAKRSKLFSKYPACITLENMRNSCDSPCWIRFNKQMNVIWHYLKPMNYHICFIGFLVQQRFKTFGNFVFKNFPSIFRAPNNMIFKIKNRANIFTVFTHRLYTIALYIICQLKNTKGCAFLCQINRAVPCA